MMRLLGFIAIAISISVLSACHPFGTSNLETPSSLVPFTPTMQMKRLWSADVGTGVKDYGLRFAMGYADGVIFTLDVNGDVDATNANTGKIIWLTNVDDDVTAGVGVGNNIVVLGTKAGKLIALDAKTGKQKWMVDLGNQILAIPQIQNNIVIVKTVADTIYALDATSGRQVWNFTGSAPDLILRLGSTPQIAGDTVYAGMASGRLIALTLPMGIIRWQQQIATPMGVNDVQQMVDIDADPILDSQRVYVATYQGRIAALDMKTGNAVWTHELSTYTGLVADAQAVYVTDAKGYLWSFAADTGRVNWLQKKLRARILTAPVLMGDNIVVADAEGYVHWINKNTGEFAARVDAREGTAIASRPLVVGNKVFILTDNGELQGYQQIQPNK